MRNIDGNDSFNPNPYGVRRKINVTNDSSVLEALNRSGYGDFNMWEIGYSDDLNVVETLKLSVGTSHITMNKEEREIRAIGCENMYTTIKKNGNKIGMQINPEKTQLLCVSSNNYLNIKSYISIEEKKLQSEESMKIVGFMFDSSPSPKAHVEYLIKKNHKCVHTGLICPIRHK